MQVTSDVDDCLAWVDRAENVFSSDLTSIYDEDAMIEAIGRHEQIYQEMDQQKDRIEAVLKRGNSMLDVIPSNEKTKLNERLNVLFKRWSSLSERAFDSESNFDSFITNQESFYENLEGFVDWMRSLGLVLSEDIEENVEREEHKENLLAHRSYCKDIKQHEEMYEMLMRNGEMVLQGLPAERKKSFHEQLQRLKEGWKSLVDAAIDKDEELAGLCNVSGGIYGLLRSKSTEREVPLIVRREVEEMAKDLNVIENGLKEVRNEIGTAVGQTEDRMKYHLAICLRSDAEMEKIDEVIMKVSQLPTDSEERRAMNAKIEELKKNWEEIAETLHRERSDLEKTIDVERNLENIAEEYNLLESSAKDSCSVESLENVLQGMLELLDGQSDIQERITNLPKMMGADVKMEMLSKVGELFEKAESKKIVIGKEIKKLREKGDLIAKIDQLSLKLATLNQPRLVENVNEASNCDNGLERLSNSMRTCRDLIESTLSLKLKVSESPVFTDEKEAKVYKENLLEMESFLRSELEGKEKEFAGMKASDQSGDALKKEVFDLQFEKRWNVLMETIIADPTVLPMDVILQDANSLRSDLENCIHKAAEVGDGFENQTESKLIEKLERQNRQAKCFVEFTEEFRTIFDKLDLLKGKLFSLENGMPSLNDDSRKIPRIMADLQKVFETGMEVISETAEKIRNREEEHLPSEVDEVLKKKLESCVESADSMLAQWNEIRCLFKQQMNYQMVEEDLTKLENSSSLGLEDMKIWLEKIFKNIEELESNVAMLKDGAKGSEFVQGLIGKMVYCKEKISDKLEQIAGKIAKKDIYSKNVRSFEMLLQNVENDELYEGTDELLKENVVDMKERLKAFAFIVENDEMIDEIGEISKQEAEMAKNMQREVLEKYQRCAKKLLIMEKSLNDFDEASCCIGDELRSPKVKNSKDCIDLNEAENSGLENESRMFLEEVNTCSNAINKHLNESTDKFNAGVKKSKDVKEIRSALDEFANGIQNFDRKIESLFKKISNYSLPSKEHENVMAGLKELQSKIQSSKEDAESWTRKVQDISEEMEERNMAISNVDGWIRKLEQHLNRKPSMNLVNELEDLERIENEMDAIGKEVSQICSKAIGLGKNDSISFSQ